MVDVKVDCEENKVAIPNAFTHNHDGINDVFAIRGISIIKHLVIFGRWGEKVFEKKILSPETAASGGMENTRAWKRLLVRMFIMWRWNAPRVEHLRGRARSY